MPTTNDLAPVVAAAAAHAGTDPGIATPIRIGDNAIYRLASGLVARISRPDRLSASATEVTAARWFQQHDIPAITAIDGLTNPLRIGNRMVSFWRELPPHEPARPRQVSAALARLHAVPVDDHVGLPPLDPFVGLDQRLDASTTLTADERTWLTHHLTDLRTQYAAGADLGRTCVIHGDAHSGNIVATEGGTVVMLDLERVAIGPPEWDLVSTATDYSSCGWLTTADWTDYVTGYGQDVTGWPAYDLFRDIRELRMTCYTADLGHRNPAAAAEATYRIRCLQGDSGPRPWPWTPM